jgi:4-azaleucine resistance transporter AzlC
MQNTSTTPLGLIQQGYLDMMPMMVGVAPFGVVFGALAAGAGMSLWEALGMSMLVIAGSSQFVAVQLIETQAPVLLIVFTVFIINLRHLLYSASLSQIIRPLHLRWKLVLAYLMIDEVYAAVVKRQQEKGLSDGDLPWYFLGSGLNLASLWWLTAVIGVWVGNIIPTTTTKTLSYILPLVFIAIVVPLTVNRPRMAAALSAAGVGIVTAPLPNQLNLIVAALVGIGIGVFLEIRQLRQPAPLATTTYPLHTDKELS